MESETKQHVAEWARELEGQDPDAIIRFAVERFGNKLAVATQFGMDGCSLVHRVSRIAKSTYIFTIDTGLLFHETYELADRLERELQVRIARVKPKSSVAEQAVAHGPNLWERDPDLCCTLRKVHPMLTALEGRSAWVTAIRKSQSHTRADTEVVQWDEKFAMVKFCPLVHQSEADIEAYVKEQQVPTNPLRTLGYASIGCMTCTRPTKPGEDPRAGRWWRTEKTECGLHTKK